MSINIIYRLQTGFIFLLLLLVCLLGVITFMRTKEGLYLRGEIFYLNGNYQEALTTFEEAINFGCPTKDNCPARENSEVEFFCALFRASARLYVRNPSASSSVIAKKYWDDLARKFPKTLDQCLKAAEDNPPFDKMTDQERKLIRVLINQPLMPTPTPTSTPTSMPRPTLTPTPMLTPTLTPILTPTLTPMPSFYPCMPTAYNLYGQPILLHPQIERKPSVGIPRVFGTNQVKVNWPSNKNIIVCLASSPDGKGALSVDDQIDLKVSRDGVVISWILNFYDPNTKGIGEYMPQDITWMFDIGTNIVSVSLYDTKEDYYYARPLWLVMWQR